MARGHNQRMAACAQCGNDLPARARFCPSCGAPAAEQTRQLLTA
jgi:predicted amidophosphoribosyltransferase